MVTAFNLAHRMPWGQGESISFVRPSMKFEKIKLAIETGLFNNDLCSLVTPPSMTEIINHSKSFPFPLSEEHIELLQQWGGSGLDEIRINSLERVECEDGFIAFANDYNGYIFKYNQLGHVYVEDSDGGDVKQLADSIADFIHNVFLGENCVDFYGVDWLDDLKKHKLV